MNCILLLTYNEYKIKLSTYPVRTPMVADSQKRALMESKSTCALEENAEVSGDSELTKVTCKLLVSFI